MSFVPEWSLYRIHMIKSNDSVKGVPARGVFAPDQKHNQSGTKFDLSLHDTRMKSCTRTTVSFGLNSRMTCMGNEMWFRYHVNTNREIYGDKMNSFQTVCHSGLWIARLNELRNKGMSRAGFWAMWKKQSNYSLLRNHSLSRHVMTHTKKCCVGAFIKVLTKNWRYQMK